jgi:hypothetical protein
MFLVLRIGLPETARPGSIWPQALPADVLSYCSIWQKARRSHFRRVFCI